MRKLISLGILALLLSMLASPVLADLDDCEDLKEDGITKGLYGLCIAYWNADNGRSQERILINYNKKKGPDDPPLLPDLKEPVFCPCWTVDSLIALTNDLSTDFCDTGELSDLVFASYAGTTVQVFAGDIFFTPMESTSCSIVINALGVENSTGPLQDVECRTELQAVISVDFGSCP
jgi:hypothetical protein